MKKQMPEHTDEKSDALIEAYNEKPFAASELTEELAVPLPDFFEGNFTQNRSEITMSFPNGQRFRLTVTEL